MKRWCKYTERKDKKNVGGGGGVVGEGSGGVGAGSAFGS